MKQLYTLICLLFIGQSIVFSQAKDTLIVKNPVPKLTLKYSPISLLDFFTPAIQFAVEHRIAKRESIQYELGYLTSFGGQYVTDKSLKGYRVRLEWRKYKQIHVLRSQSDPNKKWMKYWGLQVMFKQDFVQKSADFCREDCMFFQQINYTTQTSTIAAYWHFGWAYRVGKFRIELGVAPGVRFIAIKDKGIPDDAEIVSGFGNFFFGREPGRDLNFPLPSVALAIKAGYILWE